jgi:5'-3' exoribonuclease 2
VIIDRFLMGVPAFYRWISEKYPKIVLNILEARPRVLGGAILPVDLNEPNPNGIEFDNLYIDMNGLIHPCSHPEDREPPKNEEEMYLNVTKYIDRLVNAIRPRKVLYLAIDGVAPRAKMNQQRSRRFRSAQEARERKDLLDEVLSEMVEEGFNAPNKGGSDWDSNVITPGTEFMTKISAFLRFYILEKMNRDNYWANLTVILSDASEPGEGEHKIMDFIRRQRNQSNYNPNTHHVLHGLDADLIMLALATHEVRFTILREKVYFGKNSEEEDTCDAQKILNSQSMRSGQIVLCADPRDTWVFSKPLQALHIHILREYLDNEFSILKSTLPFQYDLERVIDDFIFMCFFVGNDFLPHLPSLDIRDGALDFLIECYKDILPSLGDYVTSTGGVINLSQADILLSRVGEVEDQIFLRKKRAEDNAEQRFIQRKKQQKQTNDFRSQQREGDNGNNGRNQSRGDSNHQSHSQWQQPQQSQQSLPQSQAVTNVANNAAADALRASLLGKRKKDVAELLNREEINAIEDVDSNLQRFESTTTAWDTEEEEVIDSLAMDSVELVAKKAKLAEEEVEKAKEELKKRLKEKEHLLIEKYKIQIEDEVKLHENGWKDRYYGEKFKREDLEKGGGLRQMCKSYIEGLCWVLKYYYNGVPSWSWYYPFHYAPFASDLTNIDSLGVSHENFTLSKPFRPLEQLLAVLPASSANALPPELRWLMLDSSSPIFDIYDENVPIDPNGKHLPWLWILLLPFLNANRITAAFESCKSDLTLSSRRCNIVGNCLVFLPANKRLANVAIDQNLLVQANERDPDVFEKIRELSDEIQQETILTIDSAVQEPAVQFDCLMSEEASFAGSLRPTDQKWFAPLHTTVHPPTTIQSFFSAVDDNRVLCLEYELPAATTHFSRLLPGAISLPSGLTPQDLQPRRPPRLNKSGFNVLELFRSVRNDHNSQGNYSKYSHDSASFQHGRDRDHHNHHNNHQHNNNNNNNRNNHHHNYHQQHYQQYQQQQFQHHNRNPHSRFSSQQPSSSQMIGSYFQQSNYPQQQPSSNYLPPPPPPPPYIPSTMEPQFQKLGGARTNLNHQGNGRRDSNPGMNPSSSSSTNLDRKNEEDFFAQYNQRKLLQRNIPFHANISSQPRNQPLVSHFSHNNNNINVKPPSFSHRPPASQPHHQPQQLPLVSMNNISSQPIPHEQQPPNSSSNLESLRLQMLETLQRKKQQTHHSESL